MGRIGCTSLICKVDTVHVVVVVIDDSGYEKRLAIAVAEGLPRRGRIRASFVWLAALCQGRLVPLMYGCQKSHDIVVLPSNCKHVPLRRHGSDNKPIQRAPRAFGVAFELP